MVESFGIKHIWVFLPVNQTFITLAKKLKPRTSRKYSNKQFFAPSHIRN